MRSYLLLSAGIALFGLTHTAHATEALADSDWFVDQTTNAGGAAVNSRGANYSLGENSAVVSGECNDTQAKAGDTKVAQAGQPEVVLRAACSSGGSSATGTSRMTIIGPVAGWFTVTASATAEAVADGCFPDEAIAAARYDDPVEVTEMTPDFEYRIRLGMGGGARIDALAIPGYPAQASMRFRSTTDIPGLEVLFELLIDNRGEGAACTLVVPPQAQELVQLLDPDSGEQMRPEQVAERCTRLWRADEGGFGLRDDAVLVDAVVPFGWLGLERLSVGFDGGSDASAAGGELFGLANDCPPERDEGGNEGGDEGGNDRGNGRGNDRPIDVVGTSCDCQAGTPAGGAGFAGLLLLGLPLLRRKRGAR